MKGTLINCVLLSCILASASSCARMHDKENSCDLLDNGETVRIPVMEEKIREQNSLTASSSGSLTGNLLEDATDFYEGMKLDGKSDTYEYGYFVLVVARIANEDGKKEMILQGKAMLKCSELLRMKYSLPDNYKLDAITIVNEYDEVRMVYDYVLAFRKSALSNLISRGYK